MKKEGKRIRRWRGGMDAVQTAQYFHDMAAEGWILEEIGYVFYIFREEAPQELTYRVVTMKAAATGEELAKYEADGWQKVTNCDEEYVFVKERDLWNDDAAERQMMVEEIDRQLETDSEMRKNMTIVTLVIVGLFLLLFFLQYGTDMFVDGLGMNLLISFGPNLLLIVVGGWLMSRRLRKKKERMLDGESVSARDTDWRSSRIRTVAAVAVGVLLIGWALYIEAGWNEKKYDMPVEVSYQDIPAVRLEKLESGELVRVGKNVSSLKATDGLHLGMSQLEAAEYQWMRWMSNFDNYVIDHRYLLIAEHVETDQRAKNAANDAEVELRTEYYRYITEGLAKKQFTGDLEWEDAFYADHVKWDRELLKSQEDIFDELHVCRRDFGKESDIHILCQQGKQVMELDYTGQAEPERILKEVEKVFEAQN